MYNLKYSAYPTSSRYLAGRIQRLFAHIMDHVIMFVPPYIFIWMDIVSKANSYMAFWWLGGFAFYQCLLLILYGQSIGKMIMGIKIVRDDDGENGGFITNIFYRLIVNGFLCSIPFYVLVDTLYIFGSDKRCLHDKLAGTRVVKA